MSRPDFSSKSVEDLRDILHYISQDKPNAATKFVALLKEKCNMLAKFREIGTLREDLAPAVRAFSVGNYVVYYRPTGDGVRIERILHAARDIDAIF